MSSEQAEKPEIANGDEALASVETNAQKAVSDDAQPSNGDADDTAEASEEGEAAAADGEAADGEAAAEGASSGDPQAKKKRRADADTSRLALVFGKKLVRANRDEDEVIDAENDFHHHQGNECDHTFRSIEKIKMRKKLINQRRPLNIQDVKISGGNGKLIAPLQ